jgi:SHS2 domain-containing protein
VTRQGHRTVPHTADLRIEAWAASRHECVAEALRGLISSFADLSAATPTRIVERPVVAGDDAELLASAADEVIYLLDASGEIPASLQVRPAEAGVVLVLALTGLESAEITGAVPKAVSFHGLRCEPDAAGRWSASMTVDV